MYREIKREGVCVERSAKFSVCREKERWRESVCV